MCAHIKHVNLLALLLAMFTFGREWNSFYCIFQITNLMHDSFILQRTESALNLHTVRLFTEGDDTRGCGYTICPPEDEQRAARNMSRILV